MPSEIQDKWMQSTLGINPAAHPGARTDITFATDDDGNEVLNVGGPSPSKAAAPTAAKPPAGNGAQAHSPKPATGPVPRPADSDFQPLRGKVPGPKNHVMCAVHHYVVDTDTNTVIANTVDEYKKTHAKPAHHGNGAGGQPHAGAQGGAHGNAQPGQQGGQHAQHGGQHGQQTPQQPAPEAAPQGGNADIQMEDEGIGSTHKGQFELKVVEAAHHAMTLARLNTQKFVLEVEGACRDFADFGEKKAADLTGQITFGDVLSSAASALMGKVGEKLVGMVTNPIGNKVATFVSGKLSESLTAAAKASGEGSVDRAGMLAALKSLPQAARASAGAIMDGVENTIKPLADGAIQAVNNGKELSNEQSEFIMPFFDGQTATGDAALQHYGVPNVSSGKAIRGEILTAMIKEFEKAWIKANATMSEKIAMTKDDLDKKANTAAAAEAQAYQGNAPPEEQPNP